MGHQQPRRPAVLSRERLALVLCHNPGLAAGTSAWPDWSCIRRASTPSRFSLRIRFIQRVPPTRRESSSRLGPLGHAVDVARHRLERQLVELLPVPRPCLSDHPVHTQCPLGGLNARGGSGGQDGESPAQSTGRRHPVLGAPPASSCARRTPADKPRHARTVALAPRDATTFNPHPPHQGPTPCTRVTFSDAVRARRSSQREIIGARPESDSTSSANLLRRRPRWPSSDADTLVPRTQPGRADPRPVVCTYARRGSTSESTGRAGRMSRQDFATRRPKAEAGRPRRSSS